MKLKTLLLGILVIGSISAVNAQADTTRECLRMKKIAQNSRVDNPPDYKKSAAFLIKADNICSELDPYDYELLIYSLQMAHRESAPEDQVLYADTLLHYYEIMDTKALYNPANDLIRAYYYVSCSQPNLNNADKFFVSGMAAVGDDLDPLYIQLYYFNVYSMYLQSDDKEGMSFRMMDDYNNLMGLAERKGLDSTITIGIQSYFDAVFPDAASVQPFAQTFIDKSSEMEVEAMKALAYKYLKLFEMKLGEETPEYKKIVDILVASGDESLALLVKKARIKMSDGKYSEAKTTFSKILEVSDDPELSSEAEIGIVKCLYNQGAYESAYKAGLAVDGKYKGEGIMYAGKSVAKNAKNCGLSTFEQKCNFIYAEELLVKAAAAGASTSGDAATCRDNFPSSEEWFREGSPSTVTISCYGVTVNVKTKE